MNFHNRAVKIRYFYSSYHLHYEGNKRSGNSGIPTTMWTVVHQVNDESPLSKYNAEELCNLNAELFVLVNYYEQSFTQKFYQLYNYSLNNIEVNKKFVSTINYNEDGFVVLDHLLLNKVDRRRIKKAISKRKRL